MGCCDEHRKVLPEFELHDKICPIINQRIEFFCLLFACMEDGIRAECYQ